MRFIRRDTNTGNGLVVRYQLDDPNFSGEVNASKDGVSLCGRWPVISIDNSVLLEEAIARARLHAQHMQFYEGVMLLTDLLTEADVWRILALVPLADDYTPSPFFVEETK